MAIHAGHRPDRPAARARTAHCIHAALLQARHGILLIGRDFDTRIRPLDPEKPSELFEPIAKRGLFARSPILEPPEAA